MNSIHRIGMAIAGMATVATVAGAFIIEGYTSAQHTAAQATAQASATATADPTPDPTVSLEPQTIYINPMPTPAIIRVVKPAPKVRKPPVVHIVVTAPPGGGDDGGNDN